MTRLSDSDILNVAMGTGSSAQSLVGRELGRFHIVERIASGGMATVYLAKRVGAAGFERNVAIKVLHQHLVADETDYVTMLLDEARLTAALDHPHVVDLYDVDHVDGELIVVMKYIEGCALSTLLRNASASDTHLPRGMALQILHDALQGLHHAHELRDASGRLFGVVHRDFSPQNILVGTDGTARVADFGIAKARGRLLTTQGADIIKGKYRYLAPEQASGAPLDRRTDIFAAGIVLWEALTSRPLFTGAHEAEIIRKVMDDDVVSPAEHRDDIPPELARACLRALEKDPVDRFQTAEDMAEALAPHMLQTRVKRRDIGQRVYELAKDRIDPLRSAASRKLEGSHPRASLPSMPRVSQPSISEAPQTRAAASSHHHELTTTPVGANPTSVVATVVPSVSTAMPQRSRMPVVVGATVLIGAVFAVAFISLVGDDKATPTSDDNSPAATATPPGEPARAAVSTAPSQTVPSQTVPSQTVPGQTAPSQKPPIATTSATTTGGATSASVSASAPPRPPPPLEPRPRARDPFIPNGL